LKIAGFEIKRASEQHSESLPSVIPDNPEDGALEIAGGGVFGTYLDFDQSVKSEADLISRYREMSFYPAVDNAIDDIVNESIVADTDDQIVEISLDKIDVLDDNAKDVIREEFGSIISMLEFNQYAYEIYRHWYIDGRLNYHVLIDTNAPEIGIQELRYVDARKLRKIRETQRKKTQNGVTVPKTTQEYYIYNEKGFGTKGKGERFTPSNAMTTGAVKIAKDSIVQVTSGLTDTNGDMVLSYLHKAIRPLNQLKSMEDSLVIYRIARAPERRIFYIDVGNLPKMKAEQYLKDVMTRFKNKLVYDSATGEIRDDRKFMTMLEDFWLPRREGGRGTEITTLPGGQNLSELDDVLFFQKQLYKSLSVPLSRMDPEQTFNLGRATEITRDEIKFGKFIYRMRLRFSTLFLKLLETQLILKKLMTSEEFAAIKSKIHFRYNKDNYFEELKESDLLRDRLAILADAEQFRGLYFSSAEINKKILRRNDDDIERLMAEMEEDEQNPRYGQAPAGLEPSEAGQLAAGVHPTQQPPAN
jgi:hypothetical protein